MRIVYVVRDGDDNEELRYSLRSLTNVPHEAVTIVGHKPAWVTGVDHIPVPQAGSKQANVNANVKAACETHPDGFVLMYDDVFITRPIAEIPRMRAGTIDQTVTKLTQGNGGKANSYITGIAKAGQILADQLAHPGPLYAFDAIHVPQHITPTAMLWALEVGRRYGCNHRLTLHGNLAGYTDAVRTVNAKIPTGYQERDFVSTSDTRFRTEPIGEWLRGLWPEPCEYER